MRRLRRRRFRPFRLRESNGTPIAVDWNFLASARREDFLTLPCPFRVKRRHSQTPASPPPGTHQPTCHRRAGRSAWCQPATSDHYSMNLSPVASSVARALKTIVPAHSIISSAATRMDGGTARPSVFAVFVLMTNSNLVGRMTGRSSGLAPRKILPAYMPT